MRCPAAGVPAVPEPIRAALLLAAASPLLLRGESLPPASPGAETSVFHSQVSPPLTPLKLSSALGLLAAKLSSLLLVDVCLLPPPLVTQCDFARSTHDVLQQRNICFIRNGPKVAESISINLTWNSVYFEDLQRRASVLLSNLQKARGKYHSSLK